MNLGAKGSGQYIEKEIPEKYCNKSKYIILNVVLISEEDGAVEYVSPVDGWLKAEVLPQIKRIKMQFNYNDPFGAWDV